jgi:hypothetical protein
VQLLRSKQKRGDGAETQDNPAAASSDGFDGERRIRNSTLSNIDEEMISSVKSSLEAVENEVLRQRNKSKLLEAKKKGSAGSASKLMFHSSDEVEHKSHGAVIRIILTVLSSAPPPFLVVAALATGDDKFYHAAVAFYPLGSQFVFLHFLITIERPSQAPGFEEKLHFWLAFWCHWGYVRRASVSGVSELGGRASERRQRPREQTSREERARRAVPTTARAKAHQQSPLVQRAPTTIVSRSRVRASVRRDDNDRASKPVGKRERGAPATGANNRPSAAHQQSPLVVSRSRVLASLPCARFARVPSPRC